MVLMPKKATMLKKENPNVYNAENNSIAVNGEIFKAGDKFAFVCIRKPGTPWGTMMRSAKIISITSSGNDVEIVLEGISDWSKKTMNCKLNQLV